MAFENGSKKELQKVGLKISKSFPLTRTTLASMESLSLPVVLWTPYSTFSFEIGHEFVYDGLVLVLGTGSASCSFC